MNLFVRLLVGAFAFAFTGIVHAADEEEAAAPIQAGVSFEVRMQAARKPHNSALHIHVDVTKDNEDKFEDLVAAMRPVFQRQVEDGLINWMALFKARKNPINAKYLVSIGSDSVRYGKPNPFEKNYLDNVHGKKKTRDIWQSIMSISRIQGSEIMSLSDYTLLDSAYDMSSKWPNDPRRISARIDYMKSDFSKHRAYQQMEREVFQPRWQKRTEIDPAFLSWAFLKVEGRTGDLITADFKTFQLFVKDVKQSEGEFKTMWESLPRMPKGYLEKLGVETINDLREMTSVTYDVVLATDGSKSAQNQAWEQLVGTWTHTNEDGSYRTKVIKPHTEQLTFFNSKGEVVQKRDPQPVRIEVIGGQKRFTVFNPNGSTWNAAFDVKDGKWYEQHRAKFNGRWTKSNPDVYWVYEKTDKPAKVDRSGVMFDGPDVDTLKKVAKYYTLGKIDEYEALFAQNAWYVHNGSPQDKEARKPIAELANIHREHHKRINGPIEIKRDVYEVVSVPSGQKYGHFWVTFVNDYKNTGRQEVTAFASFGFNEEGKLTWEHAVYDTATVPVYQTQ